MSSSAKQVRRITATLVGMAALGATAFAGTAAAEPGAQFQNDSPDNATSEADSEDPAGPPVVTDQTDGKTEGYSFGEPGSPFYFQLPTLDTN